MIHRYHARVEIAHQNARNFWAAQRRRLERRVGRQPCGRSAEVPLIRRSIHQTGVVVRHGRYRTVIWCRNSPRSVQHSDLVSWFATVDTARPAAFAFATASTAQEPPNGLAFSCRERAITGLQNANDLAREAVNCNAGLDGTWFSLFRIQPDEILTSTQ